MQMQRPKNWQNYEPQRGLFSHDMCHKSYSIGVSEKIKAMEGWQKFPFNGINLININYKYTMYVTFASKC